MLTTPVTAAVTPAAPVALHNTTLAPAIAGGGALHLIIQDRAGESALEGEVAQSGGRVERRLPDLPGFAATVPAAEADRLNRDPRVARIDLNARVVLTGGAVNSSSLINRYTAIEQVVPAWNHGYDGSEVQIAVLDSGVWPHDDLVKASPNVPANIGNRLLALNTNPNAVDAVDHLGHGTHVAGIIAGNGYDSNGQYIGIAPNSLLVSVKVSDDQGDMNEGDVITGLDWVYQANQHGMHIRIINMSLSSTAQQSYNSSALDAMVEKLWNSGVVVVTSAGTGSGTVSSAPGNDPYAITVGSIDDQYQTDPSKAVMASWSPYGYTPDGFAKPELVADGSHVVSLLAPGSTMSAQHPTNVVGTSYFMMGGTSMAAPQVAGMAALMLQAIPSLTNNQVKGVLMKHHANFSSIAYTSWLGNQGGLLNQGAVGHNDATSNQGLTWSQAYDSQHQAILAFGIWWTDVTWASASWNSSSWPSSWNSGSWNSGSWNGTAYSSGSWNSGSWNSGSWNSGSWNSGSWNSGSWNSGSWNSASWNSGSWNGAIYS